MNQSFMNQSLDLDPFADSSPQGRPAELAPVSITDNAARRINELRIQENQPDAHLRIEVIGGGCSGYQYRFSFDADAGGEDHLFNHDGASLVIDGQAMGFLAGCTLDFVEALIGSSFKIINPNAASECSCGTSFSFS
ncbi:MAG: iron-sulfur cluster assembly accessory protein [Pseudomonadota bacterium]